MTRRALVVDDDPMMVRTLADVLKITGWDVTPEYNGRAAVEAAAAAPFDVVLMDIKMPEMDGVAAFKAMKAARPNVHVILMTAFAAQDMIADAERSGVYQVMSKPVDIPRLLSTLARSLPRNQSVLLIDGDASFLRTLSDVLRMNGFDAVMAADLKSAHDILATQHPVAVLLHMHLESAGPRAAVAALRDSDPDVAVIVYSGQAGAADELQRTLPTDWIYAYLQKPFDVARVTGMLDAIKSVD